MLTGDKQETAENIGFACQLLRDDMLLVRVNASDASEAEAQLRAAEEQVGPCRFMFQARTRRGEALALS